MASAWNFSDYTVQTIHHIGFRFQRQLLYRLARFDQALLLHLDQTRRATSTSSAMPIAYGGSAKDAGLNGQLIRTEKLEKIAGK